jgi:transketolase
MPYKKVNYSNTMMYKIVSNDLNILECYVGSTTDFTKRKCAHKSNCANINCKMYNYKVYQFIRDNGDWHNWSMILIEMYPCTNHLESLQRERFWCENLNATLNSVVPSRSHKEYINQYIVDNRENIQEYKKQYREQHKEQSQQYREQHKEQSQQYREQHKEQSQQYRKANQEQINNYQKTVIYCVCGCSHTRGYKAKHERSKKHKEYVENRLYYDIRRGLDIIKKLDAFFKNK